MKVSAAFALIAVFSVIPLRANNIVLNPGFESGDFASWTVSRAAEDVTELVVSSPANSGSFSAGFGATGVGAYDSISQDLATANGQSYSLGFFLQSQFESEGDLFPEQIATRSGAALDAVGDFQMFWDGAMLLDVPAGSQTTIGFEQFSFNVRGTGTDTLSFRGYNLPSFYRLDDVSVNTAATPEPATFVAMGIGLAAILAVRRIPEIISVAVRMGGQTGGKVRCRAPAKRVPGSVVRARWSRKHYGVTRKQWSDPSAMNLFSEALRPLSEWWAAQRR